MKILFFSVPDAENLPQQKARLASLGCEITHITSKESQRLQYGDYHIGISDRCNFLIDESLQKLTNLGIFNFHPSLLPLHPGSNSLFWSLVHGDEFGVTCHRITDELDRGPIFQQSFVPYSQDETFRQVYDRTRQTTEVMQWLLLAHAKRGIIECRESKDKIKVKNHTVDYTKPFLAYLPFSWDTKISLARELLSGKTDINGRKIMVR